MALSEETIQDEISVVGDHRIVHVRTATVIKRDGTEIGRSFHRHIVKPDADISGESADVQAICNVVHTQAVKDAWAAYLAANPAPPAGPTD